MTGDATAERRGRSAREALIADRWTLLGLAVFLVGLAAVLGYEITVPREAKLFAIVAVLTGLVAYAPAARIVAWLYRPGFTYLVEVDASEADVAIWALPPATWRELDVAEGELFPLQASVPAWECQSYDPETNSATGTWRGSASDLELIQERGRIAEIRGVLEDLAKEGLGYRVMQSGMVRAAVRSVVLSFIETFERDAVYDGDEIRRAIDRTLDEWEYDANAEARNATVGDDGTLAEENTSADGDDPGTSRADSPSLSTEVTADD
ncbi:hypothetical protein [Halanaeroarchaeum sulfurireducens]|uniref:DUF8125 domain-containing protein n=1 Tax=Halanaeroarchaeum sulfurireducens TaxID=1604004 RepID=A0A0F7P869_9EURY|nr:hypothetical protein [Halanaeroarchaeum sulfurireducens]AKH97351.1 hypothetical protein HLASF_0858 [Halanaeroarchaeum sulfurireducens]ALG81753.1 hypothetical protein HLASA_0855 [Halanaeroarchaeum sulfurireducens]